MNKFLGNQITRSHSGEKSLPGDSAHLLNFNKLTKDQHNIIYPTVNRKLPEKMNVLYMNNLNIGVLRSLVNAMAKICTITLRSNILYSHSGSL